MLPSKRSHLSSQERTVWGDKSWRREGKVEDAFFFFLHGICFGKVVSSSSLAVICLVFMEPWITYHRSSEQPHFDINGQISLLEQSVQFSSVAQSCLTLWDPMNRSMPGLSVHHQLPEFTQTQVHRVSDAIQPSHPLSSPSPPAPNPSQHQGLFQWVSSSH